MIRIIGIALLVLVSNISSAQSGWGYVNYTSYKTHNGNGNTNQYGPFANTAIEFDNLLSTTNSNTTITHKGEVTLATMCNGSTGTPHWNADYYAIKFEFWFVPQETGIYTFGINSDDASDFSVDGTIISTYYGGHGASGYRWGSISMVAGTKYKIVARYQEYGGGDALYVRWSRPSAPNLYSFWTSEVTNIGSTPSKKGILNFNFPNTLDKTKFAVGSTSISSTGLTDITNELDSNKVANGYKATINTDQWESVIINPYEESIGGHRLMLDERMFNSASPNFKNIKSIKLLDIYNGSVSVYDTTGWWKTYLIPENITSKIATSQYQSSLRLQDGWYAVKAGTNISYTDVLTYKPQSVILTTTNVVTTLYNNIITVSDVYLAFKELSNGGLFGNQIGNEFVYGIQYKNADVNDDGVFNESDTYAMLQHLTGTKDLVGSITLQNLVKLIPTQTYNKIGKSNWNTYPSYLGTTYTFDINTGKSVDTLNVSVAWKGDVNLSHTSTPESNGVTTMSVKTMNSVILNKVDASVVGEIINGVVIVTITLDPLQQQMVGTQFQLNYDNTVLDFKKVDFSTKGNPTNYSTDRGSYINLGSLITDGSATLDKTTEYKITFIPKVNTTNILGLTSISATDAVSKDGTQLKVNLN